MATGRHITVASTWSFDNDGVHDLLAKFKADPTNSGDTFCKYDLKDDVFLLDAGVGAEPMPGFTQLMTAFIDDEKNNDLMEKPRVERVAVVVDPAEAAVNEDEEDYEGALVDVAYEHNQTELETAFAPPGFCEKYWVSEAGGAGCFSKIASDILPYLELLTGTDIFLEDGKIRITSSHIGNVNAALERLTCLEKPFTMATSPPVENIIQTYNEIDYRLQFQKYADLPNNFIRQILVDHEDKIRGRLFNANTTSLLVFDSDHQHFISKRNAPEPANTGRPEKGKSKIWSDFEFPEMGQPENNQEQLEITTAAPAELPAESENNADLAIEASAVIENHPLMSKEQVSLVMNWAKGAAKEAGPPDDLISLEPGMQVGREKEKVVEVKKVGGVKTRRAVGSAMPSAPPAEAAAASTPQKQDTGSVLQVPESKLIKLTPEKVEAGKEAEEEDQPAPVTEVLRSQENVPVDPTTPKNQHEGPPLRVPESKLINLTPENFEAVKETKQPQNPTISKPRENVLGDPFNPKTQNADPALQVPDSKLINLTPDKTEVEETKEEILQSPPTVLKHQDNGSIDPITPPRPTYKGSGRVDPPVPAPQWPESFNFDAYGSPKGVGRGIGRGNGRGAARGAGRGVPRTPQKSGATEGRAPKGKPLNRADRVGYNKPSGGPRLLDTSFASVEVTKAGIAPLPFSQPALIPEGSKVASSVSDGMSSSSNPPLKKAESQVDNKESLLDTPVSAADSQALYEKRLRDLKGYEQENPSKFVQSGPEHSASAHSRPSSQDSGMTLYQRRLAELEKIRAKEQIQVRSEVESRHFHRIMGQKAPAPQQQKGKTKVDLKAKRQAVLEEAWGIPKKPVAAKEERPLVNDKTSKEHKDKTQRAAVDPMLTNLYPLLKPILGAARYYPGTLNLEIQFGLIIIPTLPGSYNGNMFETKDWKNMFYPSHGLVAPSTRFINRLTSSGSDVDYILDLKDGKGDKAIQFFEEKPSRRDVSYEFHCQTKDTGAIIISISDTGDTDVTRPDADLGSVNMHCPSQTWDARVVVSSKFEYVTGINAEIDKAIQVLVDNLYIPPNRSKLTMFGRTSDGDELVIEKILLKRTTRHRYVIAPKKSDGGNVAAMATNASGLGDVKNSELINELDDFSSEEPGIFLQITEVQSLGFGKLSNDHRRFRARARAPENMVDSHCLWYEVSIISSAIEDLLLTNKDLTPGECATIWRESDILGKDAHIDTEQNPAKPESEQQQPGEENEPRLQQANIIGNTGLGEMLRIASRVVSRLDNVGFWNQGPADLDNIGTPIGLMITTAAENVNPAAPAAGATGAPPGAGGPVGGGVRGGVTAKGTSARGQVQPSESGGGGGVKDMESASVRAARRPAFGGVAEFW